MQNSRLYDRIAAGIVMVSFFLPLRPQVFAMMGGCAYFLIKDLLLRRQISSKRTLSAFIPGLIYLLYLLYIPLTAGKYKAVVFTQIEHKASLLALPIVISLLNPETIATLRGMLRVFMFACLLSCLAGGLGFLFSHDAGASHVGYRLGFERITGVHPTYMGMYLVFSCIILFFDEDWHEYFRPWVTVTLYFLLLLMLVSLLPKTPLIALAVIIPVCLYTKRKLRARMYTLLIALAAALTIGFSCIPYATERVGEVDSFFKGKDAGAVVENSMNMRRLIWTTDINLARQYWLTGIGPGRINEALVQQYFFYSLMVRYPIGIYDTHNQYMDICISFGIAGIAILALMLGLQLGRAWKNRDVFYLLLLLLFIICMGTENILNNQKGVMFYAFFTAVFFFSGKSTTETASSSSVYSRRNDQA